MARRWIDAIQNSLLGDLFVRLWPIFYLWQLIAMQEHWPPGGVLIALLSFLVVALAAWALGFMAIHARPARHRWVLERIQEAPSNGFEVWKTPPVGGLKPPRLTRAIVMALGRPFPDGAKWLIWAAYAVAIVAYGLFVLNYLDRSLVATVSPGLAAPQGRVGLFWFLVALTAVAIPRNWAVECRRKLEGGGGAPAPFSPAGARGGAHPLQDSNPGS